MKLRDSFAAALLAAACFAAPAAAQSNNSNVSGTNNSNISGVNNSNATGVNNSNASGSNNFNSGIPGQGVGGAPGSAGFSSNVLGQAQSLQQQLAAAQNALNSFTPPPAPAPSGPRYFARTSQDCPCNKPPGNDGAQERAQLEANLAKAQSDAAAFLESVKNPGPDKLGAATSGPTVGPTW
jgi:hypothetical protein